MMPGRQKKQHVQVLTSGSPFRLLLMFSLPLMAGNVFQQLYTVVDTSVVEKVLGVDSLAALGSADWMNWFVLSAVQGITQGFAILMAQEFGAGEYGNLRRTIWNSVLLAVLFAAGITAAGELLINPVLKLLNTPAEIRPIACRYLRVLYGGTPVVMAYNFEAGILRSLGDSRTPLFAMVLASLINICLDLLFVVGFGTGVEGAAAATVIAQLISAVYCFWNIRKIEVLRTERKDVTLKAARMLRLLGLGAPMALQNSIIAVGGMIVQTVVNTMGITFIAGFTATNKLYGLLEIAAISYGYAMVTYAGQNLGAGKTERISEGMRAGLLISFVTSVIISAIMFLAGEWILSLFISTTAQEGEEALEIAFRYLKIMSTFLPVLYLLHITGNCIRGLGNTLLPMVSGIAEFVMRTGAAFLLPRLFSGESILYAEILAWIGADLILVPSYFYVMKKIKSQR